MRDKSVTTLLVVMALVVSTVAARALAVLHTATCDAWAAYDPVAVPTMANGNDRQSDRSLAN